MLWRQSYSIWEFLAKWLDGDWEILSLFYDQEDPWWVYFIIKKLQYMVGFLFDSEIRWSGVL